MEFKLPKISKRNFILSGAIAAGSAMATGVINVSAASKIARLNKKTPQFNIAISGGGRFSNSNFLGKTSIIGFWGLWCPVCLSDIDNANKAAIFAKENGIEFMSIHTDGRYGRWGSVEAFFKEKGYSFPTAIDDDSKVLDGFEIDWVPTYLIIDEKGIIRNFNGSLEKISGVNRLINKAKAVKKTYR